MKQPHDWREWRRLRAWYLFQHGWTECEITEALGASKGAVSQWLTLARKGGRHALLSRVRGTHAKLTEEQKRLIPDLLWHGPEAYGFRGEVWTCPRVVEVLAREFGLAYHRDHVSRILKELGWTPQIPITRAIQRDEAVIAHWRTYVWPELRRRAVVQRRTLVFVDESAFYLLPSVVRPHGPQGQPPLVDNKLTRDHLSVMAGLTPAGKLYTVGRCESLSRSGGGGLLSPLLRTSGETMLGGFDGPPVYPRGSA